MKYCTVFLLLVGLSLAPLLTARKTNVNSAVALLSLCRNSQVGMLRCVRNELSNFKNDVTIRNGRQDMARSIERLSKILRPLINRQRLDSSQALSSLKLLQGVMSKSAARKSNVASAQTIEVDKCQFHPIMCMMSHGKK